MIPAPLNHLTVNAALHAPLPSGDRDRWPSWVLFRQVARGRV